MLPRRPARGPDRFREFSESTQQEIRSELGPEFEDFAPEDLHPKTFVHKHVLDGDRLGLDPGLDEIRSALDPRQELAEAADAVRHAADDAAGRVGLYAGKRISRHEPLSSEAVRRVRHAFRAGHLVAPGPVRP